MHILHVVQLYHPVPTGAGRYFAEIGTRLVREGRRVTVLATDAYDLEHLWAAGRRRIPESHDIHGGVAITRLPIQRMPGSQIAYPALRRLMAELQRLPGSGGLLRRLARLTPRWPGVQAWLAQQHATAPFDLIHTTNITLDFAILPAYDFARRHGIPFLCTPFVHLGVAGDSSVVRYYTMRHQIELLCNSDRVLTMTGLERTHLAARGVPEERLRRVGVGIDPAELTGGNAERFRAEQQISGPLVLYIGALARDKGAIDTIEALRQLWRSGRQVNLVLIGAPLAHFEAYYAELSPAEQAHIRLLRYASDAVKCDALAAADLFVMPSRTDSFGIVYLEAWSYGVPVVGAQAGGVPDVVADGHDGLLVPYGVPTVLAQAVARLLDDATLRQRLGAAGQAKMLHEYTWEHVFARVQDVYQEVV
ncbi:MAG TPA: glycosyltransferase family 4 protein [Roseiflexaceae bacterium]|nr:glycosyltransferase family 4 protein [Roseiflexaceae bacterium]HMP42675.1 glycosyltransferase family 4 protein [Roseiflexaceae bacterium]